MLDAAVTPAELKRLHEAGIRGVRFGRRLPGGAPMDGMAPVAHQIAARLAHPARVRRREDRRAEGVLAQLPVPVVVDHMGHLPEPEGPEHPGFGVILDLVEKRGAWVKLTGAYILSKVGPPTYADRSRLARAFVQRVPVASWTSRRHPEYQPAEAPETAGGES